MTGEYVVCAFDAHNQVKVAAHIRARFIEREIFVAADNDSVGIKTATKAMNHYNLEGWVAPGEKGMDWNDFRALSGAQKTLELLNELATRR